MRHGPIEDAHVYEPPYFTESLGEHHIEETTISTGGDSGRNREDMTPAQLRAIVTVGRMGSFTRASHILGITQPAVSRAVASLEDLIGTPLLDRSTRSVKLTKAGEILVHRAASILSSIGETEDAVREAGNTVKKSLSVGCLATVATAYLSRALNLFEASYPDVRISCFEGRQVAIEDRVAAGQADISITNIGEIHPTLTSRALWREPYHLCVPHDDPLAQLSSVGIDQIAQNRLMTFPTQLYGRSGIDPVLAATGRAHTPRISVDQVATAFKLVEGGNGIVIIPESAVVNAPPTIACPVVGDHSLCRTVGVTWQRGTSLTDQAEHFIASIVQARESIQAERSRPSGGPQL